MLAVGGLFVYGVEPLVIGSNSNDPVSFAVLSALFASILLAPFAAFEWRKDNVPLTPAKLGKASLVGLFGTALAYLAYAVGTKLSTPVNAAVLTRSEVLWSFFLSWVFLRERITARLAAYSALILIGILSVTVPGKGLSPHAGDLLLVLVPLFWQISHVIAKGLPYSPVVISTIRNASGFLFLFPVALLRGVEFIPLAIAEGFIIAVGQLIWYASIKRINLSKATAIITPAPAVAMAAALLTGGALTPADLLGFLLITAGTLGATREKSEVRT